MPRSNTRAKFYPNLFRSRYEQLQGSDWLNKVSPEDKRAFAMIGFEKGDYGRMGGRSRAEKGIRCPAGFGRLSGRFISRELYEQIQRGEYQPPQNEYQDQEGDNESANLY